MVSLSAPNFLFAEVDFFDFFWSIFFPDATARHAIGRNSSPLIKGFVTEDS